MGVFNLGMKKVPLGFHHEKVELPAQPKRLRMMKVASGSGIKQRRSLPFLFQFARHPLIQESELLVSFNCRTAVGRNPTNLVITIF